MQYVLPYIFRWFADSIIDFLNRWYVKSFLHMTEYMLDLFAELDKSFALKVNARNMLKPMYQDKNPISYILGFFFRLGRVLMTLAAYFIIFSITAGLYLLWLSIPIYFIYKIITTA